jgi:hypothetical protein
MGMYSCFISKSLNTLFCLKNEQKGELYINSIEIYDYYSLLTCFLHLADPHGASSVSLNRRRKYSISLEKNSHRTTADAPNAQAKKQLNLKNGLHTWCKARAVLMHFLRLFLFNSFDNRNRSQV